MKKIVVSDIMTRDFVSVSPSTNLFECTKKMLQHKTRSLFIVEKQKLVGLIAQKDILWVIVKKSNQDLSKIKAIEISPKKIAIIKPESNVTDAVEKMKRLKFEKLPVVQNNKLVGVLRIRDILNFNPEIYPEMSEATIIKIESEKIKKQKKTRNGICEECGHEGVLFEANGMLVCESCMDSV